MAAPQTTATAPTTSQAQSPQANATAAPAQAAATPAEVRKLKLKLDGQEVELPESEVIERAQRESGSAKRFQEASAMRKEFEAKLKLAKDDPSKFFEQTGKTTREWAEEFLIGELKKDAMNPVERELLGAKAKLKEHEDERKAAKDAEAQRVQDELRNQHAANYDKLFVEALGKSGLPRTPFTVKRMAELQLVNLKQKLNLNADQLAKVVREDYIAEQKALYGAVDGDGLLELLGEDIVKKLSKAQIAKLKAKGIKPTVSGDQNKPAKENTSGLSDWRSYQLRNRGRG